MISFHRPVVLYLLCDIRAKEDGERVLIRLLQCASTGGNDVSHHPSLRIPEVNDAVATPAYHKCVTSLRSSSARGCKKIAIVIPISTSGISKSKG